MQLKQIAGLLLASTLTLGIATAQQRSNVQAQLQPQQRPSDVPYVPTPNAVVQAMLELANVSNQDVVYDLGSGDGRIPIAAAKIGADAVGIEINSELVQQCQANASKAGVSDRVQCLQQDLFQTDLKKATVVTLYLLPEINQKLYPKLLKELKPGTRIISHAFDMGDKWKPDRVVYVQGPTRQHILYYWVVPKNN